jgi:hypothetical protein
MENSEIAGVLIRNQQVTPIGIDCEIPRCFSARLHPGFGLEETCGVDARGDTVVSSV